MAISTVLKGSSADLPWWNSGILPKSPDLPRMTINPGMYLPYTQRLGIIPAHSSIDRTSVAICPMNIIHMSMMYSWMILCFLLHLQGSSSEKHVGRSKDRFYDKRYTLKMDGPIWNNIPILWRKTTIQSRLLNTVRTFPIALYSMSIPAKTFTIISNEIQ